MEAKELVKELDRCLKEYVPVSLATVVSVGGSSPVRPGAKMIVYQDGSIKGTVGGGVLEARVIKEAKQALEKGAPRYAEYHLDQDNAAGLGMACGGNVTVFIEPWVSGPELVIAGAGHIAQHLAHFARMLDFQVVVIDDREEFACRDNFPDANEIMINKIDDALANFDILPHHYVVIVTRGHQFDESALEQVVYSQAAYLGMIGSRKKVKQAFDNLKNKGIPEDRLQKVYAPIGLNLGGERPSEIALSIAAQLVEIRSRGASYLSSK